MKTHNSIFWVPNAESSPQFEKWKNEFDIAQLRAMTSQSVLMRSLAKNYFPKSADGRKMGIYSIAEDGEGYAPTLQKVWNNETNAIVDYYLRTPAKVSLGTPSSMIAAHLSIELACYGPSISVAPQDESLDFLLAEFECDLAEGTVDHGVFAFSSLSLKPFEPIPSGLLPKGFLLITDGLNDDVRRELKNNYQAVFKE